ncbi:MAG: PKD domain-containing protein, partial [Candidatus Cloacimonetes bacterium]|nr:PKD domain-containing protein [Candidatus Cloacimonadota bacterium]
ITCHPSVENFDIYWLATPRGAVTPTIVYQNVYIESFINHDLYVSPDGDDANNDGLSFASPFQTVTHAMYHIEADPQNPKTIYIAPGTYSTSTGEMFGIGLKSYVSLQGAGPELTIFDAEGPRYFINSAYSSEYFNISGIKFYNNIEETSFKRIIINSIHLENNNGAVISDCHFESVCGGIVSSGYSTSPTHTLNMHHDIMLKNLWFNNSVKYQLEVVSRTVDYENIIISNHRFFYTGQSDYLPEFKGGRGIYISNLHNMYRQKHNFSNLLIYNNSPQVGSAGTFIQVTVNSDVNIVNATVVGNGGSSISSGEDCNINIYNSVFYDNTPNKMQFGGPSTINIHNNFYPNGQNLTISSASTDLIWGDTNIENIDDPLFLYEGNMPVELQGNSALIMAGTTDIPDFVFPETDIFGNPRIREDGTIDIGAIQYQGDIPPTVNFSATPLSGNAPLTVQFTDLSEGVINSWSWFFFGQGAVNSTQQNPSFTYTEPGTYSVRLVVNGAYNCYRENYITVGMVDDRDQPELPLKTTLNDAYPNPFNPETTISYSVKNNGNVSLYIFNSRGQKVKTLVNEYKRAGNYQANWNGADDQNKPISSGVYFYQMKAEDYSSIKKLVLMK